MTASAPPGPLYKTPWNMWVATGYAEVESLLRNDAVVVNARADLEASREDWPEKTGAHNQVPNATMRRSQAAVSDLA